MDTQRKIVTAPEARAGAGPLTAVTGYFDVLRAGHARELESIRRRTSAGTLVAVVLPYENEVFEIRARARMVAALRVVDYVVVADEPGSDALLEALNPAAVIHLEADDARRNREIAERIRRGNVP